MTALKTLRGNNRCLFHQKLMVISHQLFYHEKGLVLRCDSPHSDSKMTSGIVIRGVPRAHYHLGHICKYEKILHLPACRSPQNKVRKKARSPQKSTAVQATEAYSFFLS